MRVYAYLWYAPWSDDGIEVAWKSQCHEAALGDGLWSRPVYQYGGLPNSDADLSLYWGHLILINWGTSVPAWYSVVGPFRVNMLDDSWLTDGYDGFAVPQNYMVECSTLMITDLNIFGWDMVGIVGMEPKPDAIDFCTLWEFAPWRRGCPSACPCQSRELPFVKRNDHTHMYICTYIYIYLLYVYFCSMQKQT